MENVTTAGTSILLVDDEEVLRNSFARELRIEHFTVTTVANGSEAINALQDGQYDLVITDLIMPGVDGFSVLKAVKKIDALISVIILTGYGDMQSAIKALRLGADDFALKPCEIEELVFRIRRCLKNRTLLLERKQSEEALAYAAKVFEHSIEGIVVTDIHGTISRVNPAFTTITGYSSGDAVGRNPKILKSDRHPPSFYKKMWDQLDAEGQWAGEIWNRRKSGEIYPEWLTINAVRNPQGELTNYISIFHDITELKRQQEALEHQAQHDALTGLPNRVLFNDRLQMALTLRRKNSSKAALLFIDVDHFKSINDNFGHTAGDNLLIELSKRLGEVLRMGDTLARQGGDEFLILLPEVESIDHVSEIAIRLLDGLKQPFLHGEIEYFVTLSIGIAVAPDDGNKSEVLINNADLAMYQAKKLGRNNFQFFTPKLDKLAHHHISMESQLRKGIEQEEFELHYQPLVNSGTGRILGAEALIRWRHNETLMPPSEFIPLAEESGLILPLGEWVLNTAATQAKKWQDAGYRLGVSINISSRQFAGQNLGKLLREVLARTKLRPGRLYFEITESMLLGDISKAQKHLSELREEGGKIYLDDFGTGYSSLSYLKRLPIDGLKIDRSFIRDIGTEDDSKAIATAIVSLAKTLKLSIVAEGVETGAQMEILHAMGSMLIQGYLASPPIPATNFEMLMQQRHGFLPGISKSSFREGAGSFLEQKRVKSTTHQSIRRSIPFKSSNSALP